MAKTSEPTFSNYDNNTINLNYNLEPDLTSNSVADYRLKIQNNNILLQKYIKLSQKTRYKILNNNNNNQTENAKNDKLEISPDSGKKLTENAENDKLEIPPDSGKKLTAQKGVNYGPSGKETWYNLDMSGVIYLMNNLGYSSKDYPYWIRKDGCKMFGDYIMVAANLKYRPKGTILECSLGTAIVVDTGDLEPHQLDIAVNWH